MSSIKNILIIVACVACAGFVLYITRSNSVESDISSNSAVRQELISKTQSFIERSNKLQQINIDTAFFMDSTFTSLRSFSTPVPDQPLGRDDLFGTPTAVGQTTISESAATE